MQNRRDFLKTSSLIAMGLTVPAFLGRTALAAQMNFPQLEWTKTTAWQGRRFVCGRALIVFAGDIGLNVGDLLAEFVYERLLIFQLLMQRLVLPFEFPELLLGNGLFIGAKATSDDSKQAGSR